MVVDSLNKYLVAPTEKWIAVLAPSVTTLKVTDSYNGTFRASADANGDARCQNLQAVEGGEGVTTIGDNAFRVCRSLITASFPMATSIGVSAFAFCSNLSKLSLGTALSTADTDITLGANLFGFTSIAGNIDLTLGTNVNTRTEDGVTDIAAKKYKTYTFKSITKDQSSSIAKAAGAAAFRIYPNPTTGVVNIEGAASPQVRVLSLQGALLQQSQGNSINLGGYANGVYLVNVNGETYRVVKK